MTCKHMIDGRCSLGLFGGNPPAGVCSTCTDYDGPSRGLGDVLWRMADAAGVHKIVGKCQSCAERRARLNGVTHERNSHG